MALAMDRNRLIGRDGGLPWPRIPGDLPRFKAQTLGKPVLMGRKTYESIGRPLPGRRNLVITRDPDWRPAHASEDAGSTVATCAVETVESFEAALERTAEAPERVVIGGAMLCRTAIAHTDRLYLTVIDHAFTGDTWFDSFDPDNWTLVSEERVSADAAGGYPVRFQILERIPACP